MSETAPNDQKKPFPRLLTAWVLSGAAVAIAAVIWVSNAMAPMASSCPVKAEAAAAIDKAAQGELAALMATGQGRGYADLAFQDATGKAMTIADFKGKTLLVNFWASWCVPCREEMPALDALAEKLNDDNFQVLPINLDIGEGGLEKAKAFLDEGQFANLPLYADPTFKAFERLKTQAVAIGLPATILLDGEGCELAVLQGPAEWHSPDGEAVVEALKGV